MRRSIVLGLVGVMLSGCVLLDAGDPPLLSERVAFITDCIALARPGTKAAADARRAAADAHAAADRLEDALVGLARMHRAQVVAEPWLRRASATAPGVEASWRRMDEELAAIADYDGDPFGSIRLEDVQRHTAQALGFLDDEIEAYDRTSGAAAAIDALVAWAVPFTPFAHGAVRGPFADWATEHAEDPEIVAAVAADHPRPTATGTYGWWRSDRRIVEVNVDRSEYAHTVPASLGAVVRAARRLWMPSPSEGVRVDTAVELAARAEASLAALERREVDLIGIAHADQDRLTRAMRRVERLAADVPGCIPGWLPGAASPSPANGVNAQRPDASPAEGSAAPGG